MSFYYDDDDDGYGGGGGRQGRPSLLTQDAEDTFECQNCGSTDSYADDGGNLFCGLCFSQSQQSQNETIEHEQTQNLMARGRGGNVLAIRYASGARIIQPKKPLEAYDTSRRLPNLQECLTVFSHILYSCTKEACNLMGIESESLRKNIIEDVRVVWLDYLDRWEEGAKFYSKYHPEVRFNLRDSFTRYGNLAYNNILTKTLAQKALKQVRKELNVTGEDDDADDDADGDADDDGDGDDGDYVDGNDVDGDDVDGDETDELEQQTNKVLSLKCHHNYRGVTIQNMLDLYKRRGPKEAALRLMPDTAMIASILLAVLSKLGIGAYKIIDWIKTGKLPLLNAYQNLLPKAMQNSVELYKNCFRLWKIPTVEVMDLQAKFLRIAANREAALLTTTTIPLLIKRLVLNDLKLKPQVLELSLALLGYKQPNSKEEWLPRPLPALRNASKIVDLLGAIVVATKMSDGWEMQPYSISGPSIPWTREQVPFVQDISGYLDFCERHILDGEKVGPSRDFLASHDAKDDTRGTKRKSEEQIPCTLTVTPTTRENQASVKRLQKHHECYLELRKPKAVWADANGIGKYVVYDRKNFKKSLDNLRQLHPHYVLLLEFIAYVTHVDASYIHSQVVKLDLDVLRFCKQKDPPRNMERLYDLAVRPHRRQAAPFTSARAYFDSLMAEGHIASGSKHVYNLILQNAGTELAPTEATVQWWMVKKRKELGLSRKPDYSWARDFFAQLVTAGHIGSNVTQIYNFMQEQSGSELVPPYSTLKMWVSAKRKEVGYKRKRKRSAREAFLWARGYFDELMEEEHMIEKPLIQIHRLMKENSGSEPVPVRTTLYNWLDAKRRSTSEAGAADDDATEPPKKRKRSQYAWARAYFDRLMEEEHMIETPTEQIYHLLQENCGSEPVPVLRTVGDWLRAKRRSTGEATADDDATEPPKKRKRNTYEWARAYFDSLMQEEHMIENPTWQIHHLLQENCGSEPVPVLKTVEKWLRAKRRSTDEATADDDATEPPKKRKRRCDKSKKYKWARAYFDTLMAEGHFASDNKHVYDLILQNAGTEPVPPKGTLFSWLSTKRNEVGFYKEYGKRKKSWSRDYFDQLMTEGHIDSTAKQIYSLIHEHAGTELVLPAFVTVHDWLVTKRKEVDWCPPVKYAWARGYFDELMEDENMSTKTNTQIHNIMLQHCGDAPVPSVSYVGSWVRAKRKEA